jgi:hypothetical protein
MALSFANPLAFLGLLGIAIPVAIHLAERRRRVTIPIPTARFIAEAHRRTSRRLRIRRWLLLAMRIAMVVLLTLILAGPSFRTLEALTGDRQPRSTVIVVDTSPGMGSRDASDSRAERALRTARAMAADLAAVGEVAVAAADASAPGAFSRSPRGVAESLASLGASPRPADPAGTLTAAYRHLAGASFPHRQVVVVTDLARSDWGDLDPAKIGSPDLGVPVRLVDVSVEGSWNRAVTGIEVATPPGREGAAVALVTVAGFGAVPPGKIPLGLELDGRLVGRRLIEPARGDRVVHEFVLAGLDNGYHRLEAILDPDPAVHDDRFRAVFEFGGRPRVLLVDGSPGSSLTRGETWFLRNALAPDRLAGEGRFETVTVPAGQVTPELVAASGVVVLANVRDLPAAVRRAIAARVADGGGLMVFVGDNHQPGGFLDALDREGDLLPLRLGAATPGNWRIGTVRTDAPPLDVFGTPGQGDFGRARFGRVAAVAGEGPKPGSAVLLALDDGTPLLTGRPYGRGRVLLFGSTGDLEWNNLPTQTVFLPLLQRSVEYLAGAGGVTAHPAPTAGERFEVESPADLPPGPATVTSPDGRRVAAAGVERAGRRWIVLPAAGSPGFHDVSFGGRVVPVAVNQTGRDSDVVPVGDEGIDALARVLPVERLRAGPASAVAEARAGVDPSVYLFVLLLLLAMAEGLVSVFSRRGRGEDFSVVDTGGYGYN